MGKSIIDKITNSKTLNVFIIGKFVLSIIGGIIGLIVCIILLSNLFKIYNASTTGNFDGLPTSYYDTEFEESKTQVEANMAEHEAAFAESTQRGTEHHEQYNAAYEQFQAAKDTVMNAQSSQSQSTTDGEATNDN